MPPSEDGEGVNPPLPSRIPCISLHQPYAELVVAGIKTIETRTWEWPYEPGWLAIHAAQRIQHRGVDWIRRNLPGKLSANGSGRFAMGGMVTGLVYVTGCRPLVPADEQAACFYAPGLFAWTLAHARRLKTPIVMRGPQKIVYLDRDRVEEALGDE